jgi:hypothetical protein
VAAENTAKEIKAHRTGKSPKAEERELQSISRAMAKPMPVLTMSPKTILSFGWSKKFLREPAIFFKSLFRPYFGFGRVNPVPNQDVIG